MVARLEKTELGYAILLTKEMVDELDLPEGAPVQVLPLAEPAEQPEIRYASVDEALRIHREMEPHHADAYRELAK